MNYQEFGYTLKVAPEKNKWNLPVYRGFFRFKIPETPYSDWDIGCDINHKNFNGSIISKMDSFIRNFSAFSCAGLYIEDYTRVKRDRYYLHMMAFMLKEDFAPFLDIHIYDIERKMMRLYLEANYSEKEIQEETKRWILITEWRKARKMNEKFAIDQDMVERLEKEWPEILAFLTE